MRSFFGRIYARIQHAGRGTNQHRRTRWRSFEQLGIRRLLAADEGTFLMTSGTELVVDVEASPITVSGVESALWVDQSNNELTTLQNDGYGYGYGGGVPPEIVNFVRSSAGGGWWIFTGEVVDDEYVEGLTIEFGGVAEGATTTVRTDGTFSYTGYIAPGTTGLVSATVTDRDNLTSETEYCYIG